MVSVDFSETINLLSNGLKNYISNLSSIFFGCSVDTVNSTLGQNYSILLLRRFLDDPSTKILIVGKRILDTNDDLDHHVIFTNTNSTIKYTLFVTTEFDKNMLSSFSMGFMKRINTNFYEDINNISDQLSLQELIASKIQLMNLTWLPSNISSDLLSRESMNNTPYNPKHILEPIINYLNHVIDPILLNAKLFCNSTSASTYFDNDESTMLPTFLTDARKKLVDLTILLDQIDKKYEIPLVNYIIPPSIQEYIDSCKKQNNEPTAEDFLNQYSDSSILSQLQSSANMWMSENQKVIQLDRNILEGGISDEIHYWLKYENVLTDLVKQLQSPEVTLTLDVLKLTNIVMTSIFNENQLKLNNRFQEVKNISSCMKNISIKDFVASTSISECCQAIKDIFDCLKNLKGSMNYSFDRCNGFIEVFSTEIYNQLVKIIARKPLMTLPFEEYDIIYHGCKQLNIIWIEETEKIRDLLKYQAKQKGIAPYLTSKMVYKHIYLIERIQDIHMVRQQHQKLQKMIHYIFNINENIENVAINDISLAYTIYRNIDPLDLSREGISKWEEAYKQYSLKIERIESNVINHIKEQFNKAPTTNDMFNLFSCFNCLFFRPRILNAVQEYQFKLLNEIKDQLKILQLKFSSGYNNSKCYTMSKARDFPEVIGIFIWYRQLENQLEGLIERLKHVLGDEWEYHTEGQSLKHQIDLFAKKIDSQSLYSNWLKRIKSIKLFCHNTTILKVTRNSLNQFSPVVNYESQVVLLFKEVRSFTSLGIRLPYSIKAISEDVKSIYQYYILLNESLKLYNNLMNRLNSSSWIPLRPLLVVFLDDFHEALHEGMSIYWISDKLHSYCSHMHQLVITIDLKMDQLHVHITNINNLIHKLTKLDLSYNNETLIQVINQIQNIISELIVSNFSNLEKFVSQLNEQIEKVLLDKLRHIIENWIVEFRSYDSTDKKMIMNDYTYTVFIQSKKINLNYPIQSIRQYWMSQFECMIKGLCDLPKLKGYAINLTKEKQQSDTNSSYTETFRYLIYQIPEEQFKRVLKNIDNCCQKVDCFMAGWYNYDNILDTSINFMLVLLENKNLSVWETLLMDIQKNKHILDTSDNFERFGPITISYKVVKDKVSTQLELLQKEIISSLGSNSFNELSHFNNKLCNSKISLEESLTSIKFPLNQLDPNCEKSKSIENILSFLTKLDEAKDNKVIWQHSINRFFTAEKLLKRFCFNFSPDWIWSDYILSEWEAYQQLVERCVTIFERFKVSIHDFVIQYDSRVYNQLLSLYNECQKCISTTDTVTSMQVLNSLNHIKLKLSELRYEYDQIQKLKKLLNIELIPLSSSRCSDFVLIPECFEKDVEYWISSWSQLNTFLTEFELIKETSFFSVSAEKVYQSLVELHDRIKKNYMRFKQCNALDEMQSDIDRSLRIHAHVKDLTSPALREHHWKQLLHILNLKNIASIKDLTWGIIWKLNIEENSHDINDILTRAQGELALEEFLVSVNDIWSNYKFDFTIYKNRCKLIRNWGDIISLLDEHLSSLHLMKLSLYFKSFENEVQTIEGKLNYFSSLFDVWVTVQRSWVYLEGLFLGCMDIQILLPNEFRLFRSVDNDFLALMKKIVIQPDIAHVLSFNDLPKNLNHLLNQLCKIKKALTEYLQCQRLEFPRFYFIGDDDLLEMLGNSSDVTIVQRHLNKMFSGINQFVCDEANPNEVIGVLSKEGELLKFIDNINLANHTSLNSWLRETEKTISLSLIHYLKDALNELFSISTTYSTENKHKIIEWIHCYPCQLILLSIQIEWTRLCEEALTAKTNNKLEQLVQYYFEILSLLANEVLIEKNPIQSAKMVQMITVLVYQRNICRHLLLENITSAEDFSWLRYMRFYWDATSCSESQFLKIKIGNAQFNYGYEYLGIPDRLVQTPLTDKCFLTLSQALDFRLGGNPFGPAGTGKTETVKAIGHQLGNFVLVFCCDKAFDFQSMGRIFVGLCQVGAWGCFDEFNRLEERVLSACSEHILNIQKSLKENKSEVELMKNKVSLKKSMGIMVTMNPEYTGRSNLPDNLKQLFRGIAMIYPDKVQITEVLLFSQGFQIAEQIASKIVIFFDLCAQQLSYQLHYDFSLRVLKSVLSSAGLLKREFLQKETIKLDNIAEFEKRIIIRSVCDTMVPKLVPQDVLLFDDLLKGVFPWADTTPITEIALKSSLQKICNLKKLECTPLWVEKALQLYQCQKFNLGNMLVGPPGSGKSTVWRCLLDSMEEIDGIKGYAHILDAKCIPKNQLYGRLDPVTHEWTDGLITSIIRKIIYNPYGITQKRHWIILDGDVDPEWAENLNSVLDDNQVLTLSNGERLQISSNIRFIFEVDDLHSATLATISRCNMIWFSHEIIPSECLYSNFLNKIRYGNYHYFNWLSYIDGNGCYSTFNSRSKLRSEHPVTSPGICSDSPQMYGTATESFNDTQNIQKDVNKVKSPIEGDSTCSISSFDKRRSLKTYTYNSSMIHMTSSESEIRNAVYNILSPFFDSNGFVSKCISKANEFPHIMVFSIGRVLESILALMERFLAQIIEYSELNSNFSLISSHFEGYVKKTLLFSLCWGAGSSMSLLDRIIFCKHIQSFCYDIALPIFLNDETTLLDYEIRHEDGEWHHWRERVSQIEIEKSQIKNTSIVIETIDTVRHRFILLAWMEAKKTFILCGPPGSGKTMMLNSTLRNSANSELVYLNFSSGTESNVLLKTFDLYCEYVKTTAGLILRPKQSNKSLIFFIDEINLPKPDVYGTQPTIMLMRLIQEYGGFWKISDKNSSQWVWIQVERIQFTGACNPPTDSGRHPLSSRFLRHTPILFVDFPATESLLQVYGTFNRALLKYNSNLFTYAASITTAMVEFYNESKKHFTSDMQPHYVYSPRELTRWKLALYEALISIEHLSLEQFIRLFMYEGFRIFQDRLVDASEVKWSDSLMDRIVNKHFPNLDFSVLQRPIYFFPMDSSPYCEMSHEQASIYLQKKIKIFNEEQINVQIVLFDEVVQHIMKISRVLNQSQGHLLIVGLSGVGKTVLCKFVSWMNGLTIFQIKAGKNYDISNFEYDLRTVMRRSGLKNEKITFIFDESNAIAPGFLEHMNALLASGEIPGLFTGEEYKKLISEMRNNSLYQFDGDENEYFRQFTANVQKNLHIVFTMNPLTSDFHNRQATSPALFNRCVVNWFGNWSHDGLIQVAKELNEQLDVSSNKFSDVSTDINEAHQILAEAMVSIHESVALLNQSLAELYKKYNHLTPRDFLDFIKHFIKLKNDKETENMDASKHLSLGLLKLKETETEVEKLQQTLATKEVELHENNRQAEDKMKLIIEQQSVTEEIKTEAESIAKDLDNKVNLIQKRKLEVEKELQLVEPLLRQAELAVSDIPKKYLDELRALPNPPQLVKLAVEAVVVMLKNIGNNVISWEEVRKVLKAGDFINRVITFDSLSTSSATVQHIKQKYIDSENWDIDKIMRASSVAGPLATWVQSSIDYQMIAYKVEPLRTEIQQLQAESTVNQASLDRTHRNIISLEEKLQNYKTEYAHFITSVQMIKQEIELVQKKVQRSSQLLIKLNSEKYRWQSASRALEESSLTSLGDNLLASAFSTYCGFFEYKDRIILLSHWKAILQKLSIDYSDHLSFNDYLSKPSDRYTWTTCQLPSDDLYIENAIILSKCIRYPLIIDPSGQAINFILNMYSDKKIVSASFLDPHFFKSLENAIRFGTPFLIEDVENVDPIFNTLLNQETHKEGGRLLVTLGDVQINFSPSFTLFLTTRDPTAHFSPDLCSRVTFINFTLTPSSLQNQCLNYILKSERPDVETKKNNISKMQGEFRLRIRELEESLLHSLSNVKGNILDDDNIITTLERLKSQSTQLEEEALNIENIIAEVDKISSSYIPISEAASRMYFTLQSMYSIRFFYHYDLAFFESIFLNVLHKIKKDNSESMYSTENHMDRLFKMLSQDIFKYCALGLMHKDRLTLALQIAKIRYETQFRVNMDEKIFDMSLEDTSNYSLNENENSSITESSLQNNDSRLISTLLLPKENIKAIGDLIKKKKFWRLKNHILNNIDKWNEFILAINPEFSEFGIDISSFEDDYDINSSEDKAISNKTHQITSLMNELTITKIIRPDRVPNALSKLVETVCGSKFLEISEISNNEMREIVMTLINPRVPMVLVGSPGYDPSNKIFNLARELNQEIKSIAMGSKEGCLDADKIILSGTQYGKWVLLKNVHLAIPWLTDLEKKIFHMQIHPNFRLFLTMEVSSKIPLNLFRISFTLLFEPPTGLKASLLRNFEEFFPDSHTFREPVSIRLHLFFLLTFLHSVIIERKRYIPYGWTKDYEISDIDFICGIQVINECLDKASHQSTSNTRNNMVPNDKNFNLSQIPFKSIQVLLNETIYGARLDNVIDQKILTSFISHLFNEKSFSEKFVLVKERYIHNGSTYIPPLLSPGLGNNKEHYLNYIKNMKVINDPVWLGLIPNANKIISSEYGLNTINNWQMLSDTTNEKFVDILPSDSHLYQTKSFIGSSDKTFTNLSTISLENKIEYSQSWFEKVYLKIKYITQLIPNDLCYLKTDKTSMLNPLFRFYSREITSAIKLRERIINDLNSIENVYNGLAKPTNSTKELAKHILKGFPPKEWINSLKAMSNISLSKWITYFCNQLVQLTCISKDFGSTSPINSDSMLHKYLDNIKMFFTPGEYNVSSKVVWMGGLQYPKAFLTASRQYAAQNLGCSLDDLEIVIDIGIDITSDTNQFLIGGLSLHNASWSYTKKCIILSENLSEGLPPILLKWDVINRTHCDSIEKYISVPVYLSEAVNDIVFMVNLPIEENSSPSEWYQRGIRLSLTQH